MIKKNNQRSGVSSSTERMGDGDSGYGGYGGGGTGDGIDDYSYYGDENSGQSEGSSVLPCADSFHGAPAAPPWPPPPFDPHATPLVPVAPGASDPSGRGWHVGSLTGTGCIPSEGLAFL